MSFGVGNVLATTVRIWLRNLPRFFLLTVICYVPIVGWNFLLAIDGLDELVQRLYGRLVNLHPALVPEAASGAWIVLALFSAAIATCTVSLVRGERVGIWRGLASSLRRAPWLVGTALLLRLFTSGVLVLVTILRWEPGQYMARSTPTWWIVNGALWIVLSSVFLGAIPAAIVERRGVLSSLTRAFTLARGERFKVIAVVLVHYVLLVALYMLSWKLVVESADETVMLSRFELYSYLRFGLEILLASLGAVLAAVVFERLREAKEGPAPTHLHTVFE